MKLKLIEITHKTEICQTYEIYKHCMFMPTKEKFDKKIDLFLNDNSVKIFACLSQTKIVGIIVVSFTEQYKIEIVGIAVDLPARGKGIGFYQKNNLRITEFSEIYDSEMVIRYKCELTK